MVDNSFALYLQQYPALFKLQQPSAQLASTSSSGVIESPLFLPFLNQLQNAASAAAAVPMIDQSSPTSSSSPSSPSTSSSSSFVSSLPIQFSWLPGGSTGTGTDRHHSSPCKYLSMQTI
jgi:hypothetical protein